MAAVNGNFVYANGATAGFVLTTDGNGLATWQPSVGIDNLGNHNAEMNLNMNGFSLVNGVTLNSQNIASANGSFTNIVNSALFNGGIFNGLQANITGINSTLVTTTVANGTNANFVNLVSSNGTFTSLESAFPQQA